MSFVVIPMKNKDNRYPDDWKEIALEIKEKADWTCSKCRLICFHSDFKYNVDRSLRAMLTLTVHHADYDPSNNDESKFLIYSVKYSLYSKELFNSLPLQIIPK